MTKRLALLVVVSAGLLCLADEGMWLVNQFPSQAVKQKYGFEVTDQFLKHIQLSSVRFNNGGSGSFISPEGLLFTNHHVGRDCIQKVSAADHDYVSRDSMPHRPPTRRSALTWRSTSYWRSGRSPPK